jgi:mycothiol system anti-sigma-R factor
MKTETISCEEALRQLMTFLDDELPEENGQLVDAHLQRCRSCWSRAEFERRLKSQVAALREEGVPASLERRVRSILSSEPKEAG